MRKTTRTRSGSKYFAALALLCALALSLVAGTPLPAQGVGDTIPVEVHRGDADGNGVLTRMDGITMGLILWWGVPATVSRRDLDYDGNGRFDADDRTALQLLVPQNFCKQISIFAVACWPNLTVLRCPTEIETAILGDANDDGRLDFADLLVLLSWLHGGETRPPAPDEVLDVNRDRSIDIADAVHLMGKLGF